MNSKKYCIKDVATNGYIDSYSLLENEIIIEGYNLNLTQEKIIKKDEVICFTVFPKNLIKQTYISLKNKMEKLGYDRELEIVEAPKIIDLSSMKRIVISISRGNC